MALQKTLLEGRLQGSINERNIGHRQTVREAVWDPIWYHFSISTGNGVNDILLQPSDLSLPANAPAAESGDRITVSHLQIMPTIYLGIQLNDLRTLRLTDSQGRELYILADLTMHQSFTGFVIGAPGVIKLTDGDMPVLHGKSINSVNTTGGVHFQAGPAVFASDDKVIMIVGFQPITEETP